MHVYEAIDSRVSCRAFLSTPVPADVVRNILHAARRAPSGGNLQPWHVYIVAGAPLNELLHDVRSKFPTNPRGEGTEYDAYPPRLTEPYRKRRSSCEDDLYATVGIARDNKAARWQQFARNFHLFGAPVALFFAMDRQMGIGQYADLGMFMQNIMLLAREQGLHTCAQGSWVVWHKTIEAKLEFPPNLMLFCGMALGYRDDDAPINRLRTDRAELDEFAVFRGL